MASSTKCLHVLGYSGHAYVVLDIAIANGFRPIGYFDMQEATFNPYDLKYMGYEADVDLENTLGGNDVFPAMGSNSIRKRLVELLERNQIQQITLSHPSAIISAKSNVGRSTLVAQGVVINSLAQIGHGCIINTRAVIEHECKIDNFVHIAPGAVLAGAVQIGKGSFIGANAVIKDGIHIGEDVVIGAGSVVVKDIEDGGVWAGNPAKRLR